MCNLSCLFFLGILSLPVASRMTFMGNKVTVCRNCLASMSETKCQFSVSCPSLLFLKYCRLRRVLVLDVPELASMDGSLTHGRYHFSWATM